MRWLLFLALIAFPLGCQTPREERPWSPLPPSAVSRPESRSGSSPVIVPASGVVPSPEVRPAGGQVSSPREAPDGTKSANAAPMLPPPGRPLALVDLEQIAAANNPTIAAAESLVRQQEGVLRQETLYPNPTAGYIRTDADQPGQVGSQGVFLSQDFVT